MNLADQLFLAKAAAAEANARVKELEAQIKLSGEPVIEGEMARVTVSHFLTKRIDWKTIAERLKPTRQLLAAHTKNADTVRVSCKSKLKNAA